MTTFHESNLAFQFNSDWQIIKFDEHRFYRLLAGQGLSGVDFLGIYKKRELVLIEVKNYVDRYKKDEDDPWSNFKKDPSIFLSPVEKKMKDSLRLIDIIYQYYQRKWWFRLLEKSNLFRLFCFFKKQLSWVFWIKCYQLSNNNQLSKVLWLESPESILVESLQEAFGFYSFDVRNRHIIKEDWLAGIIVRSNALC